VGVRICVCACVCACVRACVRACVCVRERERPHRGNHTFAQTEYIDTACLNLIGIF